MKSLMRFVFFSVLIILNSRVYAANDALAQASAVPAGERIANYLQGVMTSAGEMISAKEGGDLFSPKKPFRLAFGYDPEGQVIDVYVAGSLNNFEDCKTTMELVQKLVLSLNKKIQKYYGVTLEPNDLVIDYFDVNIGQKIAKFENGQYIDNTSHLVPTPTEPQSFKMQEP